MAGPLSPHSPFAKPSPFDFCPSTYGPGGPFDYGANPYGDPVSTYDPTNTAEGIKRRRPGRLRGF